MMTNSLKDYEAAFKSLALTELEVSEGDFKLKLKKDVGAFGSAQAACSETKETARTPGQEAAALDPSVAYCGVEVKAPLLGVFYGSFGEKKAVCEGDAVREGDVLCTLEAMKMMNEVKAPVDGVVTKVLAKEGDLVEFDQVLFVIG